MQVGVCLQTVALTFDDAPDENGNTDKVLDALKAAGVKATFYVNGNNFCDSSAPPCSTTIARIKAEGHDIASHTMSHSHVDTLTDAQINTEFTALNSIVGQTMTVRVQSPSLFVPCFACFACSSKCNFVTVYSSSSSSFAELVHVNAHIPFAVTWIQQQLLPMHAA